MSLVLGGGGHMIQRSKKSDVLSTDGFYDVLCLLRRRGQVAQHAVAVERKR